MSSAGIRAALVFALDVARRRYAELVRERLATDTEDVHRLEALNGKTHEAFMAVVDLEGRIREIDRSSK